MQLASLLGAPVKSGLANRFNLMTFLLIQKTVTATTTKRARISKEAISTSYTVPKKAKTRCVPKSPSIIISNNSMFIIINPTVNYNMQNP